MTAPPSSKRSWRKFDIDDYLNPLIPRPRLHCLPRPISHFLGYRPPPSKDTPPMQLPVPFAWLSALVGGFIGIAIISAVYSHLPSLSGQQVPVTIASFGAAAVLEYNTIESPLSQPRNLLIGHCLSAVIGVGITKLFLHLPPDRFEDLRWLAGSVAVGVASAAMAVTKTVHPPAGATALLAATNAELTLLGWWLVPLVLLGGSLMGASALLVNNLTRRWPLYWWTATDLTQEHRAKVEKLSDVEKGVDDEASGSEVDLPSSDQKNGRRSDSDATRVGEEQRSRVIGHAWTGHHAAGPLPVKLELEISIGLDGIVVPRGLELTDSDMNVLHALQARLCERAKTQEVAA